MYRISLVCQRDFKCYRYPVAAALTVTRNLTPAYPRFEAPPPAELAEDLSAPFTSQTRSASFIATPFDAHISLNPLRPVVFRENLPNSAGPLARMHEERQAAMPRNEEWFAVQTRGSSEKMVCTILEHKGYEVFLPTIRRRLRANGRTIDQPLFPGYLFCQMGQSVRGLIVTTPGVVRLLGTGKSPTPVDPQEIVNLKSIIKSGLALRHWPNFDSGCEVMLIKGPLRGCCGVVRRWSDKEHLVVVVTLLQRAVAVEIDAAWISRGTRFTSELSRSGAKSEPPLRSVH